MQMPPERNNKRKEKNRKGTKPLGNLHETRPQHHQRRGGHPSRLREPQHQQRPGRRPLYSRAMMPLRRGGRWPAADDGREILERSRPWPRELFYFTRLSARCWGVGMELRNAMRLIPFISCFFLFLKVSFDTFISLLFPFHFHSFFLFLFFFFSLLFSKIQLVLEM